MRYALGVLLLAVLTWLPFHQTIDFDFVSFDDLEYVKDNTHIQQGVTRSSIRWALTASHAGNWHPLTWLSHMLDYALYGLAPGGHHLTSICIHVASTILLFLLLAMATRMPLSSWTAALLWGIHPLRAESVAWISERKDVLSVLFLMLTLFSYIAYVRTKRKGLFRHAGWFYAATLACYGLGLMAKPMLVTVPFLLLLLDYWPLGRVADGERVATTRDPPENGDNHADNTGMADGRLPSLGGRRVGGAKVLLDKIPFFLLAATVAAVTYNVQSGAVVSVAALPLETRLVNAIQACFLYIVHFLAPIRLCAFYPYTADTQWNGTLVLAAACTLVAMTVVSVASARTRPWLIVGWLWFLGTLVPVIGLIQVGEQALADRYTYVPSIGLGLMLVFSAAQTIKAFSDCSGACLKRRSFSPSALAAQPPPSAPAGQKIAATARECVAGASCRAFLWAPGVLFGILLVVLCHRQVATWRNTVTLFSRAAAVTRNNYMAHYTVALEHWNQNRRDLAIHHLHEALLIRPHYTEARHLLANIHCAAKKWIPAFIHYRLTLRYAPTHAASWFNLGHVLAALDAPDDALRAYRKATKLSPETAEFQHGLGVQYIRMGRGDEARACFEAALRLDPSYAEAWNSLGQLNLMESSAETAAAALENAIRLNPRYADAYLNLGNARMGQELPDAAERCWRRALRLNPSLVGAYSNLGHLMRLRGREAEAQAWFEAGEQVQQAQPKPSAP